MKKTKRIILEMDKCLDFEGDLYRAAYKIKVAEQININDLGMFGLKTIMQQIIEEAISFHEKEKIGFEYSQSEKEQLDYLKGLIK